MSVPDDSPRVLLEDGPLLALFKPAGLATQAPTPHPSLEAWTKDYLRTKYAKPGNVYLGIPHRLDRPVSGIVVFARNSKAAARLAEQFRDRVVRKIYRAVLAGTPLLAKSPLLAESSTAEDELWRDWLRKIPDQPRGEVVPEGTPDAKLAELRAHILRTGSEAGEERTWIEVELLTGRMHQIRLQTAVRGAPIVGDTLYGGPPLKSPDGEASVEGQEDDPLVDPSPRILLHAVSLELRHPVRYDTVRIECPPPTWWPKLAETENPSGPH